MINIVRTRVYIHSFFFFLHTYMITTNGKTMHTDNLLKHESLKMFPKKSTISFHSGNC